MEAFLGAGTRKSLFSGRPDIAIEIYDEADSTIPVEVVIGEVKYSERERTFARGLKELSKYMEFAQKDGFLSERETDISGLIITDGVETDAVSPLDGRVTHLTAEMLRADTSGTWVPDRLRMP